MHQRRPAGGAAGAQPHIETGAAVGAAIAGGVGFAAGRCRAIRTAAVRATAGAAASGRDAAGTTTERSIRASASGKPSAVATDGASVAAAIRETARTAGQRAVRFTLPRSRPSGSILRSYMRAARAWRNQPCRAAASGRQVRPPAIAPNPSAVMASRRRRRSNPGFPRPLWIATAALRPRDDEEGTRTLWPIGTAPVLRHRAMTTRFVRSR